MQVHSPFGWGINSEVYITAMTLIAVVMIMYFALHGAESRHRAEILRGFATVILAFAQVVWALAIAIREILRGNGPGGPMI